MKKNQNRKQDNSQRKLCAILFADIVGYTALMESDEANARLALQKFRDTLHEKIKVRDGQIVQFYGDGCLCLFDSSVYALEFAKDIQTTFQTGPKVPVRVGLHSGDVFIEADNVYGKAINLTSRIESMGMPGTILFSKKFKEEIKNQPEFDIISLGDYKLKNVQEPVELFGLNDPELVKIDPKLIRQKQSRSKPYLIRLTLLLLLLLGFSWIYFLSLSSNPPEGAVHTRTGQSIGEDELKNLFLNAYQLFGSDEIFEISLESDWEQLSRNKDKKEFQTATLGYRLNDSIRVRRKVMIRPRGRSRHGACTIPPIRIKLDETNFVLEGLQELENLKITATCINGKPMSDYLLKEYLVYKMYQQLTDWSFQTRLIKISYLDANKRFDSFDNYALLIEEKGKLAQRRNGLISDETELSKADIQSEQLALSSLFNFMIGNSDWNPLKAHNVKLVKSRDFKDPLLYPIPYDFDYSELVGANYNSPKGLESIQKRQYLGYCQTHKEFEALFKIFNQNKSRFYKLIFDFPYLGEEQKREMQKYLDEFYRMINAEDGLEKYFLSTCLD